MITLFALFQIIDLEGDNAWKDTWDTCANLVKWFECMQIPESCTIGSVVPSYHINDQTNVVRFVITVMPEFHIYQSHRLWVHLVQT